MQHPERKKQKTNTVVFEQDKKQLEMYMNIHHQICKWLYIRGFTDGKLQGYMNGSNPNNFIIASDLEDMSLLCEYYQKEYHSGFFKGYNEGYKEGFDKRTLEHVQYLEEKEAQKRIIEMIKSVGHDDTDVWEQFLNL